MRLLIDMPLSVRLIDELARFGLDLESRALVVVEEHRHRVRTLPIGSGSRT
jgi:hypothetical protein